MDNAFSILTVLGVVAAGAIVVRFTKGRTPWMRVLLGFAAALVAGGAFALARPHVQQIAFERDDDYAWSMIHKTMTGQYPALMDVFALDPTIEAGLRTGLLPILREHQSNLKDPAMLDAAMKAIMTVYRTKVTPVAQFGSDETVAAWGSTTVPVLQAFKRVSDEACGDYAMTGVNRSSPNAALDAALSSAQRAMVAAYKSSNEANKLPLPEELGDAYEKARTLAQPPFDDADMSSFRDLKSQPKARQCDLMLRLFTAIDRLPLKEKAAIYRTIMANR